MKSGPSEDGTLLALEGCYKTVFQPAHPKRFARAGGQLSGVANGTDGVQWTVWFDQRRGVAELAVDLEGLESGALDWPIGRLIAREMLHLSIFLVGRSYPSFPPVRVVWKRDAWAAAKTPIKDGIILDAPLHGLVRERWIEALRTASTCLGPGGKGRARQTVTLTQKGAAELDVAPHLQFVAPLWSGLPAGHHARLDRFNRARELLLPLHGAMLIATA